MYRNMRAFDAPQKALGFLVSQALRIERTVYETKYAAIQYPNLIPLDTAGPEWIKGVTYYSSDMVGRANWFHGRGDDVPHAEVLRDRFETTISMAAIGYDYDLEELGVAMTMGMDLRPDRAKAARRAAEEFIDKVAFTGDSTKVYTGLTNNASVTSGSAASGTGGTTWATKTADEILADINAILTNQFTNTYGAEMSDTLLIPYARLLTISTKRIDAFNTMSVLQWAEQNNIYTRQTGQPLMIRGAWGLETAGSGSTMRMVAYRRDPDVAVLYMPMPFQFLPAWQQGPMKFEVPGIFRISGVEVRRPAAMRYVDAI
jgi:hypothetical protein